MSKWFRDLFHKSELNFSLVWIGIYCAANSLANPISEAIGINSSVTFVVNGVLSGFLYLWIKREGLLRYYGLCLTKIPAAKFLWYLPLILFMSHNLWLGFSFNLPALDTVCYILSMFCVGFLEEVIFRGFLFKALARENVKTAIIISSVTFGMGHILNLFNGSGMELVENLCQVVSAIACGFLFVIIFHRGGSLIPCIVTHSVYNALSIFANEAAFTFKTNLWMTAAGMLIVSLYALTLCKTLPNRTE